MSLGPEAEAWIGEQFGPSAACDDGGQTVCVHCAFTVQHVTLLLAATPPKCCLTYRDITAVCRLTARGRYTATQ